MNKEKEYGVEKYNFEWVHNHFLPNDLSKLEDKELIDHLIDEILWLRQRCDYLCYHFTVEVPMSIRYNELDKAWK